MAYARSFDRYHKNWQMVFEYKPKKTDLEKWEKELQKPSRIITWTQYLDFNRKMFFIMNEKHV